jgi:tetratricopeptide (TPR) repeat protein
MAGMRVGIFLFSLCLLLAGSAIADQEDPRLASLFNQLAKARTAADGAPLTTQIVDLWRYSGSDTADLLMARAQASAELQDEDTTLKLLNAVARMRPGFAEVYFQRASLYLRIDGTEEAAADLTKAIALEPRDFRAHALLGRIADDAGRSAAALAAYRRALALNPSMEGIARRVGELEETQMGRPTL